MLPSLDTVKAEGEKGIRLTFTKEAGGLLRLSEICGMESVYLTSSSVHLSALLFLKDPARLALPLSACQASASLPSCPLSSLCPVEGHPETQSVLRCQQCGRHNAASFLSW